MDGRCGKDDNNIRVGSGHRARPKTCTMARHAAAAAELA